MKLYTVLNGRKQDKSVKLFLSYKNTYKKNICFKKTFVWNCQMMTSYVNQNLTTKCQSQKANFIANFFLS